MNRFPKASRATGFSLTELLVVVAIIAVIIGLLVPSLQYAAESSRLGRCTHQIRSLGVRVLTMAAEQNGALTWYERRQSTRGTWWYKTFISSQFTGFTETMKCASQPKPYRMFYKHKGQTLHATYRFNKCLGYRDINDQWIYPLRRLSTIPSPHRIPLVADFLYSGTNLSSDDAMGFEGWEPLYKAHRNGTAGVVFCVDGHAEQVSMNREHSLVMNPAYIGLR